MEVEENDPERKTIFLYQQGVPSTSMLVGGGTVTFRMYSPKPFGEPLAYHLTL